jgi:periplasmic divalent cation tolerance protein
MKTRKTKSSYVLLLSTAGSAEEAAKISSHLIESRHAACVNIVPQIRSIYRWKDKVNDDAESLMLIKTEKSKIPLVKKAVSNLHSYDNPELIVIKIEDGLPDYLGWISEVVTPAKKK